MLKFEWQEEEEYYLIEELDSYYKGNGLINAKNLYYIAGTLCLDLSDDCYTFNFECKYKYSRRLTELMARIYLKMKTPKHSFYEEAQEIVRNA